MVDSPLPSKLKRWNSPSSAAGVWNKVQRASRIVECMLLDSLGGAFTPLDPEREEPDPAS